MKRLLCFLLLSCYLASGAGLALREHYCMGHFAGASLEHASQEGDSHRCARCGMERKAGKAADCCKDKVKVLKTAPHSALAKSVLHRSSPVAAVLPAFFARPQSDARWPSRSTAPLSAHFPPLAGPPLYLRVRSLRI